MTTEGLLAELKRYLLNAEGNREEARKATARANMLDLERKALRDRIARAEALMTKQAESAEVDSKTFGPSFTLGYVRGLLEGIRTALREHECPDALLPDGETCPRCGGPRAPSGIGGGSWVHFPRQPLPAATEHEHKVSLRFIARGGLVEACDCGATLKYSIHDDPVWKEALEALESRPTREQALRAMTRWAEVYHATHAAHAQQISIDELTIEGCLAAAMKKEGE